MFIANDLIYRHKASDICIIVRLDIKRKLILSGTNLFQEPNVVECTMFSNSKFIPVKNSRLSTVYIFDYKLRF